MKKDQNLLELARRLHESDLVAERQYGFKPDASYSSRFNFRAQFKKNSCVADLKLLKGRKFKKACFMLESMTQVANIDSSELSDETIDLAIKIIDQFENEVGLNSEFRKTLSSDELERVNIVVRAVSARRPWLVEAKVKNAEQSARLEELASLGIDLKPFF